MTRMKLELDLELTIGGDGALRGALTPEDLEDLAELLKGMKSFDPSLKNIRMIGRIKPGSAIVGFAAPQPQGLGGIRPVRQAVRCYFEDGFGIPMRVGSGRSPSGLPSTGLRKGAVFLESTFPHATQMNLPIRPSWAGRTSSCSRSSLRLRRSGAISKEACLRSTTRTAPSRSTPPRAS